MTVQWSLSNVDTFGTAENVVTCPHFKAGIVLYASLCSWDTGQCPD